MRFAISCEPEETGSMLEKKELSPVEEAKIVASKKVLLLNSCQ